jgi:hypothetical protein
MRIIVEVEYTASNQRVGRPEIGKVD